jgi:hypothetical protein
MSRSNDGSLLFVFLSSPTKYIETVILSTLEISAISGDTFKKMDLSLPSSIAALGLAVVLSIPFAVDVRNRLHKRNGKPAGYADIDGESTPTSLRHYDVRLPKIFSVLSSILGLGVSLTLRLVEATTLTIEPLAGWLTTANWVIPPLQNLKYRSW